MKKDRKNIKVFKNADFVTGLLRVHRRGFGFLQPDDRGVCPQDIFIPKHLTGNAVDGDKVEVKINHDIVSEKGPEGRVVAIIERSRTHVAGIIKEIEWRGNILAYVPMLGTSQRVVVKPSKDFSLHIGDRIVMEVVDWGTRETETLCRISHYIGHISDPSCDVDAAIEEYELRAQFPSRVLHESEKIHQVSRAEIQEREDLRSLETFTIDPETAKDFDDALSLTIDRKGQYHLTVHIADASQYVKPGTALDQEARLRANSVYFPGYCLPMLPPNLSENILSLKPNVNRLTVSVMMHIDQEGNLLDYRIVRSVIKSNIRFTYREAKAVLDGKKKSPCAKTLKLLVKLCHLLKNKRSERGSLAFSIPELRVIVDDNGVPLQTEYIPYDITHQMIEEFMLKANEVIALHLDKEGKELPYRVHEVPSEENLKDFAAIVRAFGFKLKDKPSPKELQEFFDEALETPFGEFLSTSYIRKMQLALYSPKNIGHYGLGLTHYCHFTSPIRRYVDLTIHRILFDQQGEIEYLKTIAHDCSEQERISSRAENSVVILKKLRLLEEKYEKEPWKQFNAVVTLVKPFGIYFEVLNFMLEGFLHVSKLESDYFVFNEERKILTGTHTGMRYRSGDKITVMLKDIDYIYLETTWDIIEGKRKKRRKK